MKLVGFRFRFPASKSKARPASSEKDLKDWPFQIGGFGPQNLQGSQADEIK